MADAVFILFWELFGLSMVVLGAFMVTRRRPLASKAIERYEQMGYQSRPYWRRFQETFQVVGGIVVALCGITIVILGVTVIAWTSV